MKLEELAVALNEAKRRAGVVSAAEHLDGAAISVNVAHMYDQARHAGIDPDELMTLGGGLVAGAHPQFARLWIQGALSASTAAAMFASAYMEGVVVGALSAQHLEPLSDASELREHPRVPVGGWIDNRDGTVIRVRGIDARDYVVYERPRTPAPDSETDEERHTIDCFLEHHTHVDAVPMLGGDGA